MRFHVSLLLTTCLALTPIATASAEHGVAVRAEGYLGYSNLDLGIVDLDAFQGGGAASASANFDEIYLQGDVFGDDMDFERGAKADNVGSGLHMGWRDSNRGSVGAVGTYNSLDLGGGTAEIYRVGLESEAYLERVTLGLNAGYLDLDGSSLAYVETLFALYPTDHARINFRIGAVGIEDSDRLVTLGLGANFLMNDSVAPFLRWEASISDEFSDVFQHSLVAGLTLYFGAETPSLQTYDRSFFKQSCSGILIIGRLC